MSGSNNTIVIVSFGIVIAIIGMGGLVGYSNINNQLLTTQTQLQQLQKERDDIKKERDDFKKQIEDKDKEIKDLNGIISGGKDEIDRRRAEIQQAKEETQTVSACLQGVLQAISNRDDQAQAIFELGAVKEKCESASKIIKRIENARDEEPRLPRTSTIKDY